MKTIVIITSNFPPTNIVGALRPFRLCKYLCQSGWRPIILTHPSNSGKDLDYSLLKELPQNHEIHYVTSPRQPGFWDTGFPGRCASAGKEIMHKLLKPDPDVVHVAAFYRKFLEIQKKHHVDVILTTSPPHSIHLAGALVKRKTGIPWIVDFRDPWDYYPTKGHCRLTNPLENFFERSVIAEADAVISTTDSYSTILVDKHSTQNHDKFHVITNTYNNSKTSQTAEKDPGHFVVCYTGIFYPEKNPYGFFRAVNSWLANLSPAESARYREILRIHLIGSGDSVTRRVIGSLGLEDIVVFFDRMPHDRAIEKTLAADMVLISTGLGERTRPGWLPSKLFEYLGCRIPILAMIREGDMAKIIRETNSGYVLTSEDHDKVREILETEIGRKFTPGSSDKSPRFTHDGIERFEEDNVMGRFFALIEKIDSDSTVR